MKKELREGYFMAHLEADETIKWSGMHDDDPKFHLWLNIVYILAPVTFFLMAFFTQSWLQFSIPLSLTFIFCLALLFVVIRYVLFIRKTSVTFFITNKRVVHTEDYGKKIRKSIPLEKIEFARNPSVSYPLKIKGQDGQVIVFQYLAKYKSRDCYDAFFDSIKNIPAHKSFLNKIKAFAEEHDLRYKESAQEDLIILEGKLMEMPLKLNIEGLLPISGFELTIECPNVEGNSLQIKKEKQLQKLNKKLGAQDIEVAHEMLDNEYIFQSNDHDFLKELLNEKILASISETSPYFQYIKFGEVKTNRNFPEIKTKIHRDASVLDSHLIEGNKEIQQHKAKKDFNPNRNSELIARLNFQKDIQQKSIEEAILSSSRGIFILARKLQKYNDQVIP